MSLRDADRCARCERRAKFVVLGGERLMAAACSIGCLIRWALDELLGPV